MIDEAVDTLLNTVLACLVVAAVAQAVGLNIKECAFLFMLVMLEFGMRDIRRSVRKKT